MSLKVLVTGAAGYLGSVLCERLLNAGFRVTGIDNLMYGQHSLFHLCASNQFDFVRGDVRDESLMRSLARKADILIPLAAIVGAPPCDRDPWLAKSVNAEAIQLLNKARSPEQLLIYPSTESGYGHSLGGVCTEDSPLEPISHYARTKVLGEMECLGSPNTISLRLATVYGMSPRMRLDLLVNEFVYAAATNGFILIYERDLRRNTIHIRDVADSFLHCITHCDSMRGRVYNVGCDDAILSKEELALKIKGYLPELQINFLQDRCDADRRTYCVSSRRLRDAGFEPCRTLDDGIQELLKGYRMLPRPLFSNA